MVLVPDAGQQILMKIVQGRVRWNAGRLVDQHHAFRVVHDLSTAGSRSTRWLTLELAC